MGMVGWCWSQTFINSTHEWSTAQFVLVVRLWLLFWDLLVIDVLCWLRVASLAFRDQEGCVTAHNKCGFNRQEMALLQSRSNTKGKRKFERERYSSLGGKFKAETMGGSWFCVFPAKGAAGFRWWHSTSLTQQWLEAIMPGCRGDLLSVFQWKPPQIRGMPRLWNQI